MRGELKHAIIAFAFNPLLFLLAANAPAGDLTLANEGKSNYQIVIPDDYPDAKLAASVKQAAELMKTAFKENGAAVDIHSESEAVADKPAIYLGKTDFAVRNGVDFEKMEGWTYAFKVVGKNVIIAGNDQPDPIPIEKRGKREARRGGVPFFGTLKAVTDFLYKYMGVRFLTPGDQGVEYLPAPTITVPDDLNASLRPYGKSTDIGRDRGLYEIANGLEPMPKVLSHYGHYHGTAISPKQYGDAHPEYFVFRSGRRDHKGVHLCFSNPEVRELIYKKILDDCDKGYDIIEVGQNDGFLPCDCERCRVLYGIEPTNQPADGIVYLRDPAWSEKLWTMHRDMAERLKKDRPDKKIMVSAYAVAENPPATIKKLPDNMMVQLMHPVGRLRDWPGAIDVPAGYAAYLYLWGASRRFFPSRSSSYIQELVDDLVKHDIRMIQNNGQPMSFGIEGMNVYCYRRLMNDPHGKTMNELKDEYIEAAYGEAAAPMKIFYRKLHNRLDFMPEASAYAARNRNNMLSFAAIYTADLMNDLETLLSKAEKRVKSEKAAKRLATIRHQFDYLKHVVDTMYAYQLFLRKKDRQTLDMVIAEVEKRNEDICKYPNRKHPAFMFVDRKTLITARGKLNIEPFNWNLDEIKNGDILNSKKETKSLVVKRATKPLSLNSPEWKNAPVHRLGKNSGAKNELVEKTTFQVMADQKNLYVRFEAGLPGKLMDTYRPRGKDQELWLQECLNICLAPGGDKSQYYYLNFEPVANSYSDANHGFITDTLHPKFGWNDDTWDGEWSYENKLLKDEDKWICLVTLPFKTFNVPAPKKGDIWFANFGRVHYKEEIKDSSHRNRMKIRELSVWTERINASKNPGDGYFGEMVFE